MSVRSALGIVGQSGEKVICTQEALLTMLFKQI